MDDTSHELLDFGSGISGRAGLSPRTQPVLRDAEKHSWKSLCGIEGQQLIATRGVRQRVVRNGVLLQADR